jgi:hypothetical protein
MVLSRPTVRSGRGGLRVFKIRLWRSEAAVCGKGVREILQKCWCKLRRTPFHEVG